jgi:hypothetical protein
MKITDIIIILLFIIPGIFSLKISLLAGMPTKSRSSEFQQLISSIFLSFPIVVVSGLIFYIIHRFSNLSDLAGLLNKINTLIHFSLIVIGVSIIFGFIGGFTKDLWLRWINKIRKKLLNRIPIDTTTGCWEEFFYKDPGAQYVEVIKDGKVLYKGFVDKFALPDEDKELLLNIPEEWEEYPEIEQQFTRVKHTYINLDKGIVINEYDLSNYINYCKKLHEETA